MISEFEFEVCHHFAEGTAYNALAVPGDLSCALLELGMIESSSEAQSNSTP